MLAALVVVFAAILSMSLGPKAPQLPRPPLKDLAANRGVQLGMLANPKRLSSEPYSQILKTQYSFLTSDGELHWDKFRPSLDHYDYKAMNKLVTFAELNNMAVQAHHLVWNEDDSLPKWLKSGGYNSDQLKNILHKHIANTVGYYKGKVAAWTVVNEPFTRERHIFGLDDWWGDNLGGGTDYIDDAFRWAHQADPEAVLILNDFYNETQNEVSDAQYAYLKSAKQRGVPVGAVGIQMHIDISRPPSKTAMIANMRRFGELGYPVYITEFDIRQPEFKGDAEEKARLESQITSDVVRACIESNSCVSFNVFGMTDSSQLSQWRAKRKPALQLFTYRYQPKPSFYSFRAAWEQP